MDKKKKLIIILITAVVGVVFTVIFKNWMIGTCEDVIDEELASV